MYKLTYDGHTAGVTNSAGTHTDYDFSNKDEAKRLIDDASNIIVIYQPGHRNTTLENTESNRQKLKLVDDGYSYGDL
jgi:hypothetical protein